MNKRFLILVAILITLLLLAVGALWCVQKRQVTVNQPIATETDVFVTNVDPDVSHWQTKEMEFFTIKFPKEWYWVESDLQKTGYYSQVITNNPEFPIEQFADIGMFTGSSYRLTNGSEQPKSIPLKETEIVISTNGFGWATTNAGTPHDFLEFEFSRVKKNTANNIKCRYTSSINSIPLVANCSFEEDGQRVETHYVSYLERTYAITARTLVNNFTLENVFENISQEFLQKK